MEETTPYYLHSGPLHMSTHHGSSPFDMPPAPGNSMPPPPPSLPGVPTGNDFENFHLAMEPIRPSVVDVSADFLLGMGEPPHPELDKATADGDDAPVRVELARLRSRFSELDVTFNTAIDRAIACEQFGILELLLECGIPVEDRNLEAAITRGNVLMVARLVEELPESINRITTSGSTALSLAVPHRDVVAWLLSNGADLNLQDAWAETPLSRAVERECYSVIDMLLDAGADVKQGSPLHMSLRIADEHESLRLIARLLDLGAPVDKYEGEGSPIWEKVGFQRGTALHSASINGKLAAVQLLLANGANPLRKQLVRSFEIAESSALDEAERRNHMDIVFVLQLHLSK